jgi:hypothetical protein
MMTGLTGVPGALGKGDILDDFAIAPNQQV